MKTLILCLILLSSGLLLAHPASRIELSFDRESKVLNVDYQHKVKHPARHFIFEVKVYLNKEEIITQEISRQDTEKGGSVQYKIIDAKPGDRIKVRTNCNKTGKKSQTITVK